MKEVTKHFTVKLLLPWNKFQQALHHEALVFNSPLQLLPRLQMSNLSRNGKSKTFHNANHCIYSINCADWLGEGEGWYLSEAGCLLTFPTYKVGAYWRRALIWGWALTWMNEYSMSRGAMPAETYFAAPLHISFRYNFHL